MPISSNNSQRLMCNSDLCGHRMRQSQNLVFGPGPVDVTAFEEGDSAPQILKYTGHVHCGDGGESSEMSTTASPTSPTTSQLTSDQLTVIAASFSSLFFVVIVVLLSVIYRKDPKCCRVCSYQESHGDMNTPPQYYSSRQTLVGSPYLEDTQMVNSNSIQPAGPLFYVGLPSSYSLPSLEAPIPRLPSYESVRKKDRQRQIHMMIADRFGLNGPIMSEPPPTYEESIRQSVDMQYSILSSTLDLSHNHICPVYTSESNTQTPS